MTPPFQLNETGQSPNREERDAIRKGPHPDLDSSVRAEQRFELRPVANRTGVLISVEIRMTVGWPTFGQRIILAKTEQVVVEALNNVSKLLEANASAQS